MAKDVLADLMSESAKRTDPAVVKAAVKKVATGKVPTTPGKAAAAPKVTEPQKGKAVTAPAPQKGKAVTAPAPQKGKGAAPTPAKKGAAGTVDRGAVVKKAEPRPRTPSVTYTAGQRIEVLEGVRNYRETGNVKSAVELMKKHKTVGAYDKAMQDTDHPLPSIGLLRYLHKKGAVKVT